MELKKKKREIQRNHPENPENIRKIASLIGEKKKDIV